MPDDGGSDRILVIGAGPAGLTAAYQLTRLGRTCTVLEADVVVGGLSRTEEREGWRFDIGGHRFFTKVRAVEDVWREILPEDDFLTRPRLSRIYYRGRLFDYPLRPMNAFRGLGLRETVLCLGSYARARARPPADQSSFEGWTSARFGRRLYRIFFKTYTEKVWGVPATEVKADWAAQRIKDLSLLKAVLHAVLPRRNQTRITTLIEEFKYPRLGPGMMWERARSLVEAAGTKVLTGYQVTQVHHDGFMAVGVSAECEGVATRFEVSHVISSMPLGALVRAMDPVPPAEVLRAADGLRYRDFITVALIVPQEAGFPDNWIYVHSPDVRLGRIQNFGSWSPDLVKDGQTCLGLEYFVSEGDDLWCSTDAELLELGRRELVVLGLVSLDAVEAGYVLRVPKAYPLYDDEYRAHVATMRSWLDAHVPNVQPVGRNGMHRYNNQDHSMYTAMLAVDNIFGAAHDTWSVNVEAEYHEAEKAAGSTRRPRP